MAWPKLRGHRSRAAQHGARSHDAAADDTPVAGVAAAAQPASPAPATPAAPAPVTPLDWAGDDGTAEPPDELTQGLSTDDVPFWDLSAADDPGDSAEGFGWEHVEDGYLPDDGRALAGPVEPADPPGPVVMPVEEAGEPRPGIGQHRGNLAHLSANPRKRAWQQRAIIAVIVMVVFSVWISWRLGLTLAVIAVIADTIYRSRRRYVGRVKLTGAQRRTRRQLARLGRGGYRAMHGNLIPESHDQIDHLVVGPAGVFAIDSEAWDRRLPVRTMNARQLYHGPFSKKDRLEHARWESQQAAHMLTDEMGKPVMVRPAMAVYGPKIRWDVATIRDVDVFSGPRLRRYLRRRARLRDVQPLTDAEIDQIYRAANKAFPHLSAGSPAS